MPDSPYFMTLADSDYYVRILSAYMRLRKARVTCAPRARRKVEAKMLYLDHLLTRIEGAPHA